MQLLGNTLVQKTYPEFAAQFLSEQPIPKLVSLRCTRPADKHAQKYRISPEQMLRLCEKLLKQGYKPEELLVDESAPDHLVELQAEVMNSENFLCLRYTTYSGVGMRQALENAKHVEGIRAVALIRYFLDAASQDCLFAILEYFRNCVVELSTYPIGVGRMGHNTLFWETRSY